MMNKLIYFILPIILISCAKDINETPDFEKVKQVSQDSSAVIEPIISDTLFGQEEPSPTGSSGSLENKKEESFVKENSLEKSRPTQIEVNYNVDLGRILYVVPDTMFVMKSYEIVVRISRSNSNNDILSNIKSNGSNVKSESIKTTSKMQVELIDPQTDCFKINRVNSEKQLVDSTYTEWKFNVIPMKSGLNRLDLVVSIFINDDLKQVSYSDQILVKTNPKAQIKDFWFTNWKWIFEKLIIPVVTWLIGYWMGRKKK